MKHGQTAYKNGCRCEVCVTYMRRHWKLKDLKRNYNLSLSEFNSMLEAQNNCCDICGQELIRPCVDHNHITGVVRALLCNKCNSAIGLFDDNVERMLVAIDYLNRH